MPRVRVIPILLIQNGGLIKTIQFKTPKYVGDPINAVKIFNDKEVDELVVLDISASKERRGPDFEQIRTFTSEAFMPLAYGGGITTLEEIKQLISQGVEKVILNKSAFENPSLITAAAKYVGSQSVVVSIDAKKTVWSKYRVYIKNGAENTGLSPVEYAQKCEQAGAGEIFLNSIQRDGSFSGYDIDLVKMVSAAVNIPVVAIGGAGSIKDFELAIDNGASAVAAGSMFVFQRPHRAVLISYPSQKELKENLFNRIHE